MAQGSHMSQGARTEREGNPAGAGVPFNAASRGVGSCPRYSSPRRPDPAATLSCRPVQVNGELAPKVLSRSRPRFGEPRCLRTGVDRQAQLRGDKRPEGLHRIVGDDVRISQRPGEVAQPEARLSLVTGVLAQRARLSKHLCRLTPTCLAVRSGHRGADRKDYQCERCYEQQCKKSPHVAKPLSRRPPTGVRDLEPTPLRRVVPLSSPTSTGPPGQAPPGVPASKNVPRSSSPAMRRALETAGRGFHPSTAAGETIALPETLVGFGRRLSKLLRSLVVRMSVQGRQVDSGPGREGERP